MARWRAAGPSQGQLLLLWTADVLRAAAQEHRRLPGQAAVPPIATTTTLPSSGMRTHPELWRRTTIGIRRRLDRLARDQDRAANTVSVNVVLKDATAYAVRDPPHSVGRQRLFYG